MKRESELSHRRHEREREQEMSRAELKLNKERWEEEKSDW